MTIEIKWPWAMLPLSVADEYIDYLQKRIGPGHPLYGRKIFPACRREDTQELIVQFDLDDDNTHAVVFFDQKQRFGDKKMPRVEMIGTVSDLKRFFDQEHEEAMKKLETDEDS